MNGNRAAGGQFERELCRLLGDRGFWVHNLAQNSQGQPFDLLAARGGIARPIDCKVCARDRFALRRIEENQALAMRLWRETGNGEGWFALKMSDGTIHLLPFSDLEALSHTQTALDAQQIKRYGLPLGEWVALCR